MAIPKLPKSTRINGVLWRVYPKRQAKLHGEEVEGCCHFDRHALEISVGSEDDYKILSTFYHEVLHAIIDGQGISLTDTQEHGIIAGIERWLAANCDLREKPRKPKKSKVVKDG